MPRKLRLEFPGAMYHIMSRGDQREDIFLGDVDRYDFLKTLAEACRKTDWQVHAFCLMRNHYHLVVETPHPDLVAGMAWLQSTYTIRLNNRHNLTGHVLSGRYKAQLVEGSGNGYLRTACDYVHLNPVRAHLLSAEDRLLGYPWSSFPLYLSAPEHRPQWLRADRLLGEHGIQGDTPAGRQEYERQMERRRLEEVDEDKLEEFRHAWFLDTNRSTIQPPPTPSFNLGSDELCTENILFYGLTPPINKNQFAIWSALVIPLGIADGTEEDLTTVPFNFLPSYPFTLNCFKWTAEAATTALFVQFAPF